MVKRLLDAGQEVINLDKLTYAADKKAYAKFFDWPNHSFIHGDIYTIDSFPECDIIINFAAESHVDNSIRQARNFSITNALGVQNLLELARGYEPGLRPLFVQISTDEVYGDNADGFFDESAVLKPSNPYAASKAAAEHILTSYARTYGIKYKMLRLSNNYGVRQYPEKLIPRTAMRLITGQKAQLHGDGSYLRSWLNVEDSVDAILTVITQGDVNETYNATSDMEMSNSAIVHKITDALDLDFGEWVEYVGDRPGQDVRYGIDDQKLRALGWKPERNFDEALAEIISDARENPHW